MSVSSKFSALLLAGSVSLAALAGSAFAAPLTYTDMIKMDRINGFKVDPTGRYAVLNIRVTDMEKNKGIQSIWLKDLSKPEAPEIKLAVSDGGASNAQFGPDGSIYFISGRGEGGTDQVWKTDITGATATQVTRLPLDIQAYQITPDGKGVVVGLAVFPECKGDEINCTVKRQTDRKADKSSGTVYDKIFVRHWDTWADGTRNHLFYVPLAGGAPIALTDGYDGDVPSKPFGDEADYTISPDSKTVVFSAREAGKSEPWSTNFDIYTVPIDGSAAPVNRTATNKAWDGSPRVSPDGKTIAYVAMKRPGFEADRFGIMLMDEQGKTRELAPDWDRSVGGIQWSKDGKSLLVDADDVGKHIVFRVDAKTGKVTPLTRTGHTSAYAETPRGMVFLKDDLTHPSAFYQAKAKSAFIDEGATNLTKFNAAASALTTGAYEQFVFKGWNNEDVHGYVIKPAGYVEGKSYPVAFLIHGGPQGSFGDGWSYRWNPETYSGAGYAVVMIDFHGSTGYGQAFTDAISQHWGDRPLEDLQKGWAFALDKYKFLDGDRACALGASYGGFMVNWIAGNWKQPWKCLVSHDGVFDARNMGYSTEELWFEEWEQGGLVYDDPAKYDTFNPALHAKDWSKPMLVIHSDKDYRIPVEQGIGAFTALQRQGVESAFLRFPDENHWVLKPANSMKWHDTVFNWLDTHIGAKSTQGAK
ncbi:S9 family peptidase [Asticcacaulis sp. 201]|uniref:dipeptidyl-peptidase 5 n=1 Tax=Asticcacaulis sp. 201 TaxID=3028787 RepID=UPI0029169248|nr:S9 family peptidase [Asticcacaulis sp. 201]MDV6332795.1 S9 family peptidase [Asticcacaulis sp. 201]